MNQPVQTLPRALDLRVERIDLRVVTLTIPPQEVITKDNVPARVNAVVLFNVVDPEAAVMQVENYAVATSQIAQTTLRSVLGRADLDTLLAHREDLNHDLREIIELQTKPWGVDVSVVEIKDVDINETMVRAIARRSILTRSTGSPAVCSALTSAAPGIFDSTPTTFAAVLFKVARSSPNTFTATSERTPEISSSTRNWIGCE